MTDTGFEVVLEDLARARDEVTRGTLPTIEGALSRTGGTRVGAGTFSHLEPGSVADSMATGIAERLEDRLRDMRTTFEGVVDRLEATRLTYEQAESTNRDSTRGVL